MLPICVASCYKTQDRRHAMTVKGGGTAQIYLSVTLSGSDWHSCVLLLFPFMISPLLCVAVEFHHTCFSQWLRVSIGHHQCLSFIGLPRSSQVCQWARFNATILNSQRRRVNTRIQTQILTVSSPALYDEPTLSFYLWDDYWQVRKISWFVVGFNTDRPAHQPTTNAKLLICTM